MSLIFTSRGVTSPPDKYLFILDASNSMWAQIEGKAKIDIAKEVLTEIVTALPSQAHVALAAYGHQSEHQKRNCRDISFIASYKTKDQVSFGTNLASIQPKGQTPIAATLIEAGSWLNTEGQENDGTSIVLITDGIESCGGDPCAAAKGLAGSGIDLKLHVVGFDLTKEQQQAVGCISELGGGKYVDAKNADELQLALSEVTQAIETAPQNETYFEDNFSGDDLEAHWSVGNSDDELFIVEDDELLLVGAAVQSLSDAEAANIFTLDKKLPKGDWDVHLDLKMKMQTGADMFEIGFYKDHENFLALQYFLDLGDWCKRIAATFNKVSKGKSTTSTQLISADSGHCGAQVNPDTQAMIDTHIDDGFKITLSKRGREYFATTTLNGILIDGGPLSFTSDSLTSLRLPGQLVFTAGQFRDAGGETLVHIDRIEITTIGRR